MLITESITVGSPEHEGLFKDWVRQLAPYVAAGHRSFSPQKYIHAEYRGSRLAGGRFVRQKGNGQTVSCFSPAASSRKNLMPVVHLQIAGRGITKQRGRECVLGPGQFSFFDLARPCEIERSGDWEVLAIQFPSSCFQPLAFHEALILPMRSDFPSDALFYNTAYGFWDAAQTVDYRSHGLIFDTLRSLTLLTSAFGSMSDVRSNVRVDRAKAFIEQRLDDEDLSAAMVAEAQGISRRHLDDCFTQTGPSVDAFIWERRLVRAAEKLSQVSLADRSLLQISLDCGFKGPSHFSRAFRSRFGIAPRAYRRNALNGRLGD